MVLSFQVNMDLEKNHSCKHAILELTGHILQAKNNGEQTACVFLDLNEAFDMLDHHILLSKLEKYGIRGIPLKWFKSYLDGRSLVAKIQTSPNIIAYSDKFDISFGTAQGSCLGPLLFLIFINDVHYLDLYSKLILFADDTTLFNSQKCTRYLQYTIDHDLNMLLNWFKANKLSLNLQKTVMMWFGKTSNSVKIKMDDLTIPTVKYTKFLVVYLDDELTWHVHINYVLDKIRTNKRLLACDRNPLDNYSLKNIYYAHIHSHITYTLTAWGSMASKTELKDLRKIQNQCICIINKRSATSDIAGQYEKLRILKLDHLINLQLCKLGHMISHDQLLIPIHKMFEAKGGKKLHRYPTQRKHIPNVEAHSSETFNKSFMCRSIMEYNLLPQHLRVNIPYRCFISNYKAMLYNNFQA